MRFLIVGCGSIGQRHLRNLKDLGYQVTGCETDPSRAKKVAKQYGIKVVNSLDRALDEKYDAAFICTPTSLHIPIAIKVAKKKINLFIEKPLSNTLKGVKELSYVANKNKLITLVACNTRFYPGLRLAKKIMDQNKIGKILSVKIECGFYLPYWHPKEDYRKEYSANKDLGGGVIFDDIHEIDSLYWLFGEVMEVFCFADKVSKLKIDTEDIAEIFLKFKTGVIAQIHLDYLQRTYRRYYKFIGENGTIVVDFIKQSVKLYSKTTNQWKVFQKSMNTNTEKMFIDETKHFISCIRQGKRSVKDIQSAKEILKIVMACHESAAKKEVIHKW